MAIKVSNKHLQVIRGYLIGLLLTSAPCFGHAAEFAGPTDAKAQKTFGEAQEKVRAHRKLEAIDAFKKADKQDGHHCGKCATELVSLGLEVGDNKLAIEYANELVTIAQGSQEVATAHALRGIAEVRQGSVDHKKNEFAAADQDLQAALVTNPKDSTVLYYDGLALSNLMQDDAAHERFAVYAQQQKPGSMMEKRALRYVAHPELGRARLAPAFEITTLDGQQVSLDDLLGKVVLIDFWATWCGPCIHALPSIQHIAQKFAGQPLVVISISLDTDEGKWKNFVAAHQMTWMQAWDRGWNGPIVTRFGVNAIPHTFSIDADGVLQDEHVGDEAIEGKLKKLIAQAQQMQTKVATGESAAVQ
jgi:thiol-disulfide isomerase/thioredoxin